MHHIFTHSLVGVYFGCFLFFDRVNIAPMNTVLQAFAWTRFLFIWGMCLGMDLAGHIVTAFMRRLQMAPHGGCPGCTFRPAVREGLARISSRSVRIYLPSCRAWHLSLPRSHPVGSRGQAWSGVPLRPADVPSHNSPKAGLDEPLGCQGLIREASPLSPAHC